MNKAKSSVTPAENPTRPPDQQIPPGVPIGTDGKPMSVEQQLQILKNQFHAAHGQTGEVFGNIFNQLVQAIASLQNLVNEKDGQLIEAQKQIVELNHSLNSGKLPEKPKVKIRTKKQ